MSDNQNSLDAFLSSDNEELSVPKGKSEQKNQSENQEGIDLEDEFSKLLNEFIAQDMGSDNTTSDKNAQSTQPKKAETSLDSLATSNEENDEEQSEEDMSLDDMTDDAEPEEGDDLDDMTDNDEPAESGGLDSMIDATTPAESGGLDSMIDTTTPEESGGLDSFAAENSSQNEESFGGLDELITPDSADENSENSNEMKDEEQELARAIDNFQDGMKAMASKKNFKLPKFDYDREMLIPNYKPSIGRKIAQYLLDCWTIINKYDPENMKRLSPTATDEEYLTFAEELSDTYMQLAIISYVEILMNMEICENTYQQRKEEIQKRRIKKELYEEYMELQERKKMFIEKLKEKNFPIDAKNLIDNYFRAAQKDPDGSFEALTKNPAMFSPIQVEKIHPKFFGLIKVTPEDGIKANQKIGKFIKNLKV